MRWDERVSFSFLCRLSQVIPFLDTTHSSLPLTSSSSLFSETESFWIQRLSSSSVLPSFPSIPFLASSSFKAYVLFFFKNSLETFFICLSSFHPMSRCLRRLLVILKREEELQSFLHSFVFKEETLESYPVFSFISFSYWEIRCPSRKTGKKLIRPTMKCLSRWDGRFNLNAPCFFFSIVSSLFSSQRKKISRALHLKLRLMKVIWFWLKQKDSWGEKRERDSERRCWEERTSCKKEKNFYAAGKKCGCREDDDGVQSQGKDSIKDKGSKEEDASS